MKISKLLFALMIGASLVSCKKYGENHHEISQSAKNAFLAGYPGAENAVWEKDGDFYEVKFNYNYTEYEVKYDKKGYVVEIEYGIGTEYLPEGVLAKVEAKYPGKKIEASYIEYRRFGFYEVEVSEDGHHEEGEHAEGEEHEIEMFFKKSGEEFDAEKKVECIEKCHAGVCTPKKDKSCCKSGEKKACCDKKKDSCEKDAHAEGAGHGEMNMEAPANEVAPEHADENADHHEDHH
ncbi:MAG: PepSY-like domain-containing protein [Crocinitomicaceae bacterium]|nr:PepSY-like domain-containing protein [Crocinitomicaceae bacterium]